MKKILLPVLAAALLLAPAVGLTAAPDKAVEADLKLKPVVVVTLSSYDQLKSDIEFLGKLAGAPGIAKQIEAFLQIFTQGEGLAGLDKSKPLGAALLTDDTGLTFPALGFVPVTDLKKLLEVLGGLIQAEDEGDGVYKIETDRAKIYLKERNGWAFISNKPDQLDNLPKDPLKIIGGLAKDYDVGVRVFVQNVPESLRDLAMDQIKGGMQAGLKQGDDESDEDFALRKKLAESQVAQIDAVLHELDQMTLGWNIDAQGSRSYLDIDVTAVANSKTAKDMAAAGKAPPSKLAGVLLGDALATMHANSAMSESDIEQVTAMLPTVQKALEQKIDDIDELGDDDKQQLEEMLDELIEIAEASIEKGQSSMGLSVVGGGPFTIVLGTTLAEGNRLEALAKKALKFGASKAPEFPEVKYNVATQQGVKFHQLSIPVPDRGNDETKKAEKVIGNPIQITLGFGPEVFLAAIGPSGIDTLKTVLTNSAKRSNDSTLPPSQLTVSLAPILKFASEQEDADPVTGLLAKSLKESGKDHILLTQTVIANGTRIRLEVEEGVLKILGMAGKMSQKRGGPGN